MQLNDKTIEKIIRDEIDLTQTLELNTNRKNILIVEGKTDREIIERIAYHQKLILNFDIIEMKGVSNFQKLYDVFGQQNLLSVRYLTDNDYSARRWLTKLKVDKVKILTAKIYDFVQADIREIEEYITNQPHGKNRALKKKMLQSIWSWKNVCHKNVEHLIQVIDNAFAGNAFIKNYALNSALLI